MNMSCIIDFIRLLDSLLVTWPGRKLVLCADVGRRSLTNAVFLIGAYMIVRHNRSSAEVSDTFRSLQPNNQTEPYRDATYSVADFALELIDCWRGLEKGVQHGWVR
jgi:hypothetical protein